MDGTGFFLLYVDQCHGGGFIASGPVPPDIFRRYRPMLWTLLDGGVPAKESGQTRCTYAVNKLADTGCMLDEKSSFGTTRNGRGKVTPPFRLFGFCRAERENISQTKTACGMPREHGNTSKKETRS